MNLENYFYKKTGAEKYALESSRVAYKDLTKNSLKLFFLTGDNLPKPLVTGSYEPHIWDFIDCAAACGSNDFLIYIGANIGLISCQSGYHFREIHMFEPNPTCAAILKLNTCNALSGLNYTTHEYCLGESDREAMLKVSAGNMDGAFINDGVNSYSAVILAMKDNFQTFEESNYLEKGIHIRCAEVALNGLFQSLSAKGLKSGVIKIYIEGYEPVILNAIAKTSKDFDLVIIFESWDKDYDFEDLLKSFGGRATGYRLKSKRPYQGILHRMLKKFSSRHPADDDYQLISFAGKDAAGDLVIKVERIQ